MINKTYGLSWSQANLQIVVSKLSKGIVKFYVSFWP